MTDEKNEATVEVKKEETEEETVEEASAEKEDAAAVEEAEEENAAGDDGEDDEKPSGKSNYRHNRGGGGRRHNSYARNNRAVYHQSDESDPSCRVYVGNLAWEVTWKELKDHMKKSECEIVRADILASPDGRSKGCGIVEFESEEGAKRALMLNDSELMGRQIFVREDRESGSGGGYYTQQPGSAPSAGGGRASAGNAPSAGGEGNPKQDCRVYVGNLSWDVSWQDLKDHMRSAGEVSFAEVMQEPDGRSKGCGVVEFESSEEAKAAIDTLNDSELKGRMVFVREDRETGRGGGGGGGHRAGGGFRGRGGGGGGGGGDGTSTSVYVGNLAYETSWQDLKDHMRQAGNVDQANILQSEDGRSKGCGIVVYQHPRDVARAIRELQTSVLHGRPIFVREDREQGGRRGGAGGGRGHRNTHQQHAEVSSGCQLFVGNLSWDTNPEELQEHFGQCGNVENVNVIEGHDGRRKGFGTVCFSNEEDAAKAIETLHGVELDGRQLQVRYDNKAGRGR